MKTKVLKIIATIVSFVVAISLSGCGGGGPTLHDVTYAISGSTTRADVTLTYFDGSIGQYSLKVPYTTTPLLFKDGEFIYLSAQNYYSTGTVTVTINVDGKPWKQVTSSGAYAIATVSGSCC